MTPFYDMQQQGPLHNWQQMGQSGPQFGQHGSWLGNPLAAFGQPNGQQFGQPWGQWGPQQRQLSPYDVNEVVRQLVPALPQIIAQAQQPYSAMGYAAYGPTPRTLTPQDVNEVVRQLLPLLPQIVGTLQGQPLQQFAMHGGLGGIGGFGQNLGGQQPFAGPFQQPWQFGPLGQQLGQHGGPQFLSAFGGPQQWGQGGQWQRQLTQQDVTEVTRQLAALIPQVISNLQTFNQQRTI